MAGSNTQRGLAQRDLRMAVEHVGKTAFYVGRAMLREFPHTDRERDAADAVRIHLEIVVDLLYTLRDQITPQKALDDAPMAHAKALAHTPYRYEGVVSKMPGGGLAYSSPGTEDNEQDDTEPKGGETDVTSE